MLGTLPLRLRPPGAIPQGQPRLDPNDPINVGRTGVWLFTSNINAPANLVTGLAAVVSPGTPSRSISSYGLGALLSGNHYALGPSSDFYNANITIGLVRTFVGPAAGTGTVGEASASGHLNLYLPYNNTGDIYWDFPNEATGRVHFTTTILTAPEAWVITGGTRGKFLWRNNSLLFADATQTQTGAPGSQTLFLNFGTQGGGPPQQVYIFSVWDRQLLPGEAIRWCSNPWSGLIFPSDFNIGMFGGASAPVVSPFFVPNFDLRPNIKINPDLRSFTDDRVINLIGSDSVYAGPGQVPSYELKTAPRPPARKDYVKTTDIQLIGQDIIYGGPGQVTSYDNNNPVIRKNIEPISWFQNLLQSTLNIIFFPFAQLDWPNPNRRKNDINKTWADNSKIQLIGQDTFFGAPGQTKVYDYPNPILRKDDVTKRTWIASLVYGISATIVLAQQAWNWNKNTYSFIFNYNLAQRTWQWVPNSSIIQYTISLVARAWQWKGQSPIFSGGNFNKVKRVIQAFMVSINRFMNR